MKLRDWKDVLTEDWPRIGEVTRKTIGYSVEMAKRDYRTSMRVATGRVYVDADYEAWRQRVLATPLP